MNTRPGILCELAQSERRALSVILGGLCEQSQEE